MMSPQKLYDLTIAHIDLTVPLARCENPAWVDEETGDTLHECNDCGVLIPVTWPLCSRCQREESDREQWEVEHPETRCPPRE